MTTTMNVTVTYRLSAAGQKAALLAGRPASQTVTEMMALDNPVLLDKISIGPDGSLALDVTKQYGRWAIHETLALDAPPQNVAEVIDAYSTLRSRVDAKIAEEEQEEAARAQKEREEKEAKAARDFPVVEEILAELEALDPLAKTDLRMPVVSYHYFYDRYGTILTTTDEQWQRTLKVVAARESAEKAVKEAAAKAKEEQHTKMIEEYGGYLWKPEGGFCNFLGFNLWSGGGQSRRWVGIFTEPKGVAEFLDSPRGEHTFKVEDLKRGDCIQGGGFDTNSRGRRRNESEWFGIVIRNDENGLVVRILDSRAACFKAAKNL